MYARREPSGEIATRPAQKSLGPSASVESHPRLYSATRVGVAGRIHPRSATALATTARAVAPYSMRRKRRLDRSCTIGADGAGAVAGLFNASANSCADENRSAGTFSSARDTAVATFSGTFGRSALNGRGASVRTFA